MNNKPRKIKNIEFDGENLHLDLRVSIPRSRMSGEFISDILKSKDSMINGTISRLNSDWIEFACIVEDDSMGNEIIKIEKTAKKL
tara:strand:- start:497 stop:751 length:255 start_codon:yes stop_codon:yes gene_type:complete